MFMEMCFIRLCSCILFLIECKFQKYNRIVNEIQIIQQVQYQQQLQQMQQQQAWRMYQQAQQQYLQNNLRNPM